MRRLSRVSVVALTVLFCFVIMPRGRSLHAEDPPLGSVSVVASGVTKDSTASNNQVKWDEPVALSTGGGARAHHPSVAVTASGDVHVAWDQDDGQIYLGRYAGRWEPVVCLTTNGGNTFPSISADGTEIVAVWTHTEAGQSAVYFVRIRRQ